MCVPSSRRGARRARTHSHGSEWCALSLAMPLMMTTMAGRSGPPAVGTARVADELDIQMVKLSQHFVSVDVWGAWSEAQTITTSKWLRRARRHQSQPRPSHLHAGDVVCVCSTIPPGRAAAHLTQVIRAGG